MSSRFQWTIYKVSDLVLHMRRNAHVLITKVCNLRGKICCGHCCCHKNSRNCPHPIQVQLQNGLREGRCDELCYEEMRWRNESRALEPNVESTRGETNTCCSKAKLWAGRGIAQVNVKWDSAPIRVPRCQYTCRKEIAWATYELGFPPLLLPPPATPLLACCV